MEKSTTNSVNNIDPVCGMKVDPGRTKIMTSYQGQIYHFCAEACRNAFETNPGHYLKPTPEKRKGWWERYLDRLTKANEKAFGRKRPKCC